MRYFLSELNAHLRNTIIPGTFLVVDEKISPYEGLEGEYRAEGAPVKVKIQRKPRGVGIEIKCTADGETGCVIFNEIQEGKDRMARKQFHEQYGYSTAVTLRCVQPWANSWRIVIGDSAFGSVKTLMELYTQMHLFSMMMVKQCSSQYPKAYLTDWDKTILKRGPESQRGTHIVLQSNYNVNNEQKYMYAVGWADKKCKMIICNVGTSLPAQPAQRNRHRKITNDQGEAITQRYLKFIDRPNFIEMFFRHFSVIDVGDHLSQGSLQFHTVWRTQEWWLRLFSTLDAEIIVNSFYHYKCEWIRYNDGDDAAGRLDFPSFVDKLSYEMIHNRLDGAAVQQATLERRRIRRQRDHREVLKTQYFMHENLSCSS